MKADGGTPGAGAPRAPVASIVLGGYPAKQCPRHAHNDHVPGLSKPPVTEDVQRIFDAGVQFEEEVTGAIEGALGDAALVLPGVGSWDESVSMTMNAMRQGVDVIVNGRLPDIDGRAGAPDVLLRAGDGYLPVDIKNHKTLGSATRSSVEVSSLSAPLGRFLHPGPSNAGAHWRDDCMQLAHYTRMLQGLGHHSGGAGQDGTGWLIGGIIGTSHFGDITGQPYGITWYDLAADRETTYSASAERNRKKRSALERYDHEFAFRATAAQAARAGESLVRPLHTDECDTCVWLEHCRDVAGPRDASFAIKAGRLSHREWLYLYGRGGATVDGLAALDASALAEEFRLHAVGKHAPDERLRRVVRRARMTVEEVDLEPIGDWPTIPSADVEVDFDIEWDVEGRIYQWGIRVRQGQDDTTAVYDPVVSFEPLTDEAEEELANRLADKVAALVAEAEAAGKTMSIYHWHHVERSRTRRFARVDAVLEGRTIDLLAWFDQHFFCRDTSSIKTVAPLFGFAWTVEDPGGLLSMEKIQAVRAGGPGSPAMRQWLLDYNASDVAAQAAIRDGLRRLGRLSGRGSTTSAR